MVDVQARFVVVRKARPSASERAQLWEGLRVHGDDSVIKVDDFVKEYGNTEDRNDLTKSFYVAWRCLTAAAATSLEGKIR